MKGYQRKIVYLKNTGSPYFEQAYFVVRDGLDEGRAVPRLSEEADRILGEHVRQRKNAFSFTRELLFFLSGAAVALGVSAILLLIWFL